MGAPFIACKNFRQAFIIRCELPFERDTATWRMSFANTESVSNQSMMYGDRGLNPSSPPFTKGRNRPSLAKRSQGRFSQRYVFL
jgi:hypothetical protein